MNFNHIRDWNFSNFGTFFGGLISYILIYFKEFKNPIQALFFKVGIKKDIILKFKDNKIPNLSLNMNEKHILTSYINSKFNHKNKYIDLYIDIFNQIDQKGEYIDFRGIKIPNEPKYVWLFFEFYGSYDIIDYTNRTVIDIGANIGDTSLNFANNNASSVYAYEVVPYIHELSKKILKLNPQFEKKVHFFNQAVSSKKGSITIYHDENDANIGGASSYSNKNTEFEITTTTIHDILIENNISADVLKMDCEGCEYNIILNSDLSCFNDIIMEYHNVDNHTPEELFEKLKNEGFTLRIYPDKLINNLGIVHAFK